MSELHRRYDDTSTVTGADFLVRPHISARPTRGRTDRTRPAVGVCGLAGAITDVDPATRPCTGRSSSARGSSVRYERADPNAARPSGEQILLERLPGGAVFDPGMDSRLVFVAPAAFADPAQARELLGRRSRLARRTTDGSLGADMACRLLRPLRRPVTVLAPLAAQEVDADIARDGVAHMWPGLPRPPRQPPGGQPPARLARRPAVHRRRLRRQGTPVTADDALPLLDGTAPVRLEGTHLLSLAHADDVARDVLSTS